MVKNLPAMWDTQVQSLGWEDSLEKELATPLQYSCLENSVDRGAWWATVHGSQRVTFIKKGEFEYRHTQRECHVEIGAVQPPEGTTRSCKRSLGRSFSSTFRGSMALPILNLDLRLLGSRTVRE